MITPLEELKLILNESALHQKQVVLEDNLVKVLVHQLANVDSLRQRVKDLEEYHEAYLDSARESDAIIADKLAACEKDRDVWRQKAIELGLELSEGK